MVCRMWCGYGLSEYYISFSFNHHGNNHVHIYVYIYTHHVVGSCLFAAECRHVLVGSSAQVCIYLRFTVSLTQPMGEIEVPPHLGVTANELMTSQVLFLKSRQITDLDCAAIAPCLKQNASLRQLFIGYNEFGDEGARHLCEALAAVEGVTWKLSKKHFGSFVVHKQLDRCMRFRRAESGRCKLWVQNLKYCSCYAGCHVNACHRMPIRGCSWAGRLSALQNWRWSCASCGRFHQVQQNNSGHLDTIFAICVAVTCQELLHCNLMTRFPWSFAFFLVFHQKRTCRIPATKTMGIFLRGIKNQSYIVI